MFINLMPGLHGIFENDKEAPVRPQSTIAVEEITHPSPKTLLTKVRAPDPLAVRTTNLSKKQLECLAAAIHFEARGEPVEGQVAVAEVILARVAASRWPSSICKVVKQRKQFSFVRGGNIPHLPGKCRDKHIHMAQLIAKGSKRSSVRGSQYFHATYVRPIWRLKLKRIGKIGQHIFYQEL